MHETTTTSGRKPAIPINQGYDHMFADRPLADRMDRAIDILHVTEIALGNRENVSDGGNIAIGTVVGIAIGLLYDTMDDLTVLDAKYGLEGEDAREC